MPLFRAELAATSCQNFPVSNLNREFARHFSFFRISLLVHLHRLRAFKEDLAIR
jgi:hypothetical protein